jgi:hypothetical protein
VAGTAAAHAPLVSVVSQHLSGAHHLRSRLCCCCRVRLARACALLCIVFDVVMSWEGVWRGRWRRVRHVASQAQFWRAVRVVWSRRLLWLPLFVWLGSCRTSALLVIPSVSCRVVAWRGVAWRGVAWRVAWRAFAFAW